MDLSYVLTGKNLLLLSAVFAMTQVLKSSIPWFTYSVMGQRLIPILPIVLGVIGSLVGLCSENSWPDRVAIGIIAGFSAGQMFKVGKTTLLGKGVNVQAQTSIIEQHKDVSDTGFKKE